MMAANEPAAATIEAWLARYFSMAGGIHGACPAKKGILAKQPMAAKATTASPRNSRIFNDFGKTRLNSAQPINAAVMASVAQTIADVAPKPNRSSSQTGRKLVNCCQYNWIASLSIREARRTAPP